MHFALCHCCISIISYSQSRGSATLPVSTESVLWGGVHVPQSIELKDNAAYSTVQTQSALHNQSIAVNDNVAYRTTTEKADLSYDYI